MRFSIGVHPHQAHQFADDPPRAGRVVLEQFAATPSARAVGEIGLDYHYDYSPREVQQAVFRSQVRLARELQLPVIIHAREADEDTIAHPARRRRRGTHRRAALLHGDARGWPRRRWGSGFYVSAAGIVTFPKAGDLRETLKAVPLDRLLTETDSPFLAPVPYRGKRNEPAHVARVVDTLAGVHGHFRPRPWRRRRRQTSTRSSGRDCGRRRRAARFIRIKPFKLSKLGQTAR